MNKLAFLLFAAVVACGGDDDKDAGADAAAPVDATTNDAPADAAPADAGIDAPVEAGCSAQSCLDKATGCANDCDSAYNMCEGNCTTSTCMSNCKKVDQTCLAGCLSTCKTCAGTAPCANLCADASTP